jgi:hypothetical protein
MVRLKDLFGRGDSSGVDLPGLQARLAGLVTRWAGRQPDPDLIRARLADGLRQAEVSPPTPQECDPLFQGFDDEGWRRLAVLAGALDQEDVRAALPELARQRPPAELFALGFAGVARGTPLLTLDLLARGPLRVEELARRLLAGLGLAVRGESERVSRERLERLDYGRLLAEAERAREAAADRVEKLRKLQEMQELKRRRGKW